MIANTQLSKITALTWGVKQSFRNYVQSVGGVIEVGGGAEVTADGEFGFAAGPDSSLGLNGDGKLEGRGVFLGHVRFTGHGGMLSVFLADPVLELSGVMASLTIDDHDKKPRRLEIAKLDLKGMTSGEIAIPAALSIDGIQVLGDHYPLKTALDPVRLSLSGA
jgi:hypothetical protein